MRSREPDPLGADIVHMREDGRYGADIADRFGSPRVRVKVLQKVLVDVVCSSKEIHCGSSELSVNLESTRGHGSLLLAP